MDLTLNNLQRLICHKTQITNQPNPVFTYVLNIYDLKTHFVDTFLKRAWADSFLQLNGFKYFDLSRIVLFICTKLNEYTYMICKWVVCRSFHFLNELELICLHNSFAIVSIQLSVFNFIHQCCIDLEGRVFTNGPGDQSSIPGRVIPKKDTWYHLA